MRIRTGFGKAIALLMTFGASLVLAVQLGCNGSNSPTAVAPPPPGPAPTAVLTGAQVTFMVNTPVGQPGEILFDGRTIWVGLLEANALLNGYCCDYSTPDVNNLFHHVFTVEQAALTPGVHTLTFRAPGRTAVNFLLSGWIDLHWSPAAVGRVGSWQDESAWLKTGRDWTREIVFPAQPNG